MRPQPVRANAKLDNCSTCAECEDLCDALEDILDALHKPDNNTPERLRVINEVQWIALKCSPNPRNSNVRSSRITLKRLSVSIQQRREKKNARSVRSHPTPPPVEGETLSMEEDISSDDSSKKQE
ncbi:hypothetical protein TNCV_705691 [Trichonephila clavipes]|nr:hypothetical protein TNCV_705691 [Trichonephila clavipes]